MRKTAMFWMLAGLAACVPENDPVVVTDSPDLEQRAAWQATLAGTAAFPAVAGSAQIADFGPYFDATLSFSGASPTTAYQWRIFPGTCATPGATQFGPVQAYPNVTTNASGAAQLTRTISGPLDLAGAYNVRVSTVATPVRIVACGNLARS